MIERLPRLPTKSCYTNLKFFETLKDTPNPSKGFRFVAFLVLEILGGPFRPPLPLVLFVGTKTLGARRVKTKVAWNKMITQLSNKIWFFIGSDFIPYFAFLLPFDNFTNEF